MWWYYMICVNVIRFLSIRIRVHCDGSPLPLLWPSGLRIHSCFGLRASSPVVLIPLLDVVVVVANCICPIVSCPWGYSLRLYGGRVFPRLREDVCSFTRCVSLLLCRLRCHMSLLLVSAICCIIASARSAFSISDCYVAQLAASPTAS